MCMRRRGRDDYDLRLDSAWCVAQAADPIYHVQDNKVGCAPLYCIQNNKVGDASPLYGCWRNKAGRESGLWHSEQ